VYSFFNARRSLAIFFEEKKMEKQLSQGERQGRLISTHNVVPVGRDYKSNDAEKAFARAQGILKTSPAQEAREEAKAAEVKADATAATETADLAEKQEAKEQKKTSAKKGNQEPADSEENSKDK
jgi:hypothetical protein